MDKQSLSVNPLGRCGEGLICKIMTNLDEATGKLDAALARLEGRLGAVLEQTGDPGVARREVEALTEDRARLAEELDAALAREKELQALADEASVALGSAIAEVRAALERQGDPNGQG